MGARGRKSAIEKALSLVDVNPAARPAPPAGMNAVQSGTWRAIVASLPADWIRPSDVPMLAAYCAASETHGLATTALETAAMVLVADNGREYANPLIGIQASAANRMSTLAMKLRLCPSTRYRADMASTKAATVGAVAKPWEAKKTA